MWSLFPTLGRQLLEDVGTWREHSYNAIEGSGIGGVARILAECLASLARASINMKPIVSMHLIDSWIKLIPSSI